jgi:hypothetical protein
MRVMLLTIFILVLRTVDDDCGSMQL